MQQKEIGIVMPARNETTSFQNGFLEKVFAEVPEQYHPTIFVAVNNSNPDFVDLTNELSRNLPNVKAIQLGNLSPRTFAYAYLEGMSQAVEDGMQQVIEMDATGAHDPCYIPDFLNALSNPNNGAAFSSRFSQGGGIHRYPLQRKLISAGGTVMTNLFMGLGQMVPDMTSGYEAFQSETLEDIFGVWPIENWISVNQGPGHFYQVEMRTIVIWRDHRVEIVPIQWGSDRAKDPNTLPFTTVSQALNGLFTLRSYRDQIKNC